MRQKLIPHGHCKTGLCHAARMTIDSSMLGLESAPGKSRVIADAALGNFADRKAGARGSAATIRRCFRGAPHIMGRSELRARAAPDVATVRLAYAPDASHEECTDQSDALRNDICCCMSGIGPSFENASGPHGKARD